jgi:hypothetical protein
VSHFDNPEPRQVEAKAMALSVSIIIALNELSNKNTRSGATTIILIGIVLGCFIFDYFKGGLFCIYEVLNVYSISLNKVIYQTPTSLDAFIVICQSCTIAKLSPSLAKAHV